MTTKATTPPARSRARKPAKIDYESGEWCADQMNRVRDLHPTWKLVTHVDDDGQRRWSVVDEQLSRLELVSALPTELDAWLAEHETGGPEAAPSLASSETDNDEAPTVRELLHAAWNSFHGIEQVAKMLYDYDSEDEVAHGAAFTIKQAAEHGYELIDEVSARFNALSEIAKGGAA